MASYWNLREVFGHLLPPRQHRPGKGARKKCIESVSLAGPLLLGQSLDKGFVNQAYRQAHHIKIISLYLFNEAGPESLYRISSSFIHGLTRLDVPINFFVAHGGKLNFCFLLSNDRSRGFPVDYSDA